LRFLIVALLAITTVALAHGHFGANSPDESHCPFCTALHAAKQVLVNPAPVFSFQLQQVRMVFWKQVSATRLVIATAHRDRAPPLI
jgi:hypothetical protein